MIVAVIDTIALAFLGIPVPLLWGLLAFITNYIPNIGFVIGLIPPALLGLLEGGLGADDRRDRVYCVINLVIQSVIQPKFVGDAVGLSTTLTFLSLVFWAWVLGPLGALLAIPLTLLAKALLVDVDPTPDGWCHCCPTRARRNRRAPADADSQRSRQGAPGQLSLGPVGFAYQDWPNGTFSAFAGPSRVKTVGRSPRT